jgi:hypothetical protein
MTHLDKAIETYRLAVQNLVQNIGGRDNQTDRVTLQPESPISSEAPMIRCQTQAYWKVDWLGHAWSGGRTPMSYSDPHGPNASQAMYAFIA